MLASSRVLRSGAVGPNHSWYGLGPFAAGGDPKQEACWTDLKNREVAVSNVIESAQRGAEDVDWEKWEKVIAHKDLLEHMKKTYMANVAAIEQAMGREGDLAHLGQRWELYESAQRSCRQATSALNHMVADGSKALWISQNNPPAWKVDTNEWLESDQYWQAFVEKHAMYSQSGDAPDPEAPSVVEANKASWNNRMFKYNERTDTPILYDYMNHLPAWEFYDINRKQFYEHMSYFLLRTGDDFRHFPDLPSWQWLTHIEDLRFREFAVMQRRKAKRQVEKVARYEPDDFGTEEGHTGEEEHMAMLTHEKNATEMTLAKLMGNFAFLCDPFVPVQSRFQLQYILSKDNYGAHKGTQVYSLGDDLNALFVLPHNANIEAPLASPLECFHTMMEHYRLMGMRLNPSFATRAENQVEVIQQRGPNWLKLKNETVMEAFLRRLRHDDPLKGAFEEYAQELRERIAGAKLVPPEQWEEAIAKVENQSRQDDLELGLQDAAKHAKNAETLRGLDLQRLMDDGHLLVLDPVTGSVVRNAADVLAALK